MTAPSTTPPPTPSTTAQFDSADRPRGGAPGWRRSWPWLALIALVLIGAVLVGLSSSAPAQPLDPGSAAASGSKALIEVLSGYGTTVTATDSVDQATGGRPDALVVTSPDDYMTSQLRRLAASTGRLVLIAPDTRVLTALGAPIQPDEQAVPDAQPGCGDPNASAVGQLQLPGDATAYSGGSTCFGGMYATSGSLVVLGSADLLRNDHLAERGVAALDVNTITNGRQARTVAWLSPGSDATGSGPTTIWALFPAGVQRAFWWLVVVGVLLLLWGLRRLGGPIAEPLPVVVRSVELVEGHGRLYRRAGARERAADALRAGTTVRLVTRFGLPRDTGPAQLAASLAPRVARAPAELVALLAGPPPPDDAGLVRLAHELDALEQAVTTER